MSFTSKYSGAQFDAAINNISASNSWIPLTVSGVSANSTVTAVCNTISLQATANSNGVAVFDIAAFGKYTVAGRIGSTNKQDNILITQVKAYSVDLSNS